MQGLWDSILFREGGSINLWWSRDCLLMVEKFVRLWRNGKLDLLAFWSISFFSGGENEKKRSVMSVALISKCRINVMVYHTTASMKSLN